MDKQGHGMQAGYVEARLCIRACTPSASSDSYLRSHSLGRAQSFTLPGSLAGFERNQKLTETE